jgi:GNAT superfamily N-acetyltransferase
MHLGDDLQNEALIIRADPACHLELSALALRAKQMWGYPPEWMLAWANDLRITSKEIESHPTFAATLNGVIVGFYMLRTADEKLWLEHLWVEPHWGRQGIGSKLFRHASEEARKFSRPQLWIEADPNAEPFYLKQGAQRVSEIHTMMYGYERTVPVLKLDLAPKTHPLNG